MGSDGAAFAGVGGGIVEAVALLNRIPDGLLRGIARRVPAWTLVVDPGDLEPARLTR